MHPVLAATMSPASLDLFKWLVGLVLSGGTATAYLTYKIQRRKAPAETDSIAIQGVETAVVTMQKVLDSEVAAHQRTREDRDRLQREVDEQRDEIRGLLAEIEVLRTTVGQLQQRALAVAHRAGVDTDPNGIRAVPGPR